MASETKIGELTEYERQLAVNALEQHSDALHRYAAWVDDKPALPEREVAIQRVRDEARDAKFLAYYLRSGKRLPALSAPEKAGEVEA